MARSILNTTLEFGVVSVPIAVMPVTSKQEMALDRANAEGHALERIDIDAVNGAKLEKGEERKGIFKEKPSTRDRSTWADFREIPKDVLDDIAEATAVESFEIEGFMPLAEVPFERAQACYYIAAQHGSGGAALKPLRLLYEALKGTNRAGILKIAIRARQHAAVIYAKNGGLFMNTLAWAEDAVAAKEAEEVLAGADTPDPKMVALAATLIENMEVDGTLLDGMRDSLRPERERLIEDALKGKKPKKAAKAAPKKDDDSLEAMLAASIKAGPKKPRKKAEAATV